MLVIEINDVDAQPFKARIACAFDIIRLAGNAETLAIWSAYIAEFGRDDKPVTSTFYRASE